MGLLTPLAVRIGSVSWMPRLLPQIVAVDKSLHRLSGGRVTLLDIAGLPNLTLTVVGRKSGVPRSTPLLCVPHDGGWLVAGSYFGGPKMPLWVGNLRAAGVSDDTPLAYFYAWARVLRIVDGADAVHRRSIAREELRRERPHIG